MQKYYYDSLLPWSVFGISLIIYILTLEPSVSLWDCGEFIASAYKLQVTHPPGAPLYMLIARVFAIFAPNVEGVALFVNLLSAVASAFTIFFLFKIVLYLFEKQNFSKLFIQISAFSGALVFAVSDSFWFSAVEAEVYALSIFFSTLIFWLMLKWESKSESDESADKYLIVITLLLGLSVGVHLLNLLVIPALVFIWFFKKKHDLGRFSIGKIFIISILILFYAQYILLKGFVKLAGFSELFFVNNLNFPFHSGLVAFLAFVLIISILILIISRKTNKPVLHFFVLGTLLFLLGFSTYFVILIRAEANPPMNQNNPNTIFGLETYLNRDQYGTSPLFYGSYFDAEYDRDSDGTIKQTTHYKYVEDSVHYVLIPKKIPEYHFKNSKTIFPRMQMRDASSIDGYRLWGGLENDSVSPNFGNNLQYFAAYQLGQMYFRYLLWNFAGRQNDMLGQGHFERGNFISGFYFLDKYMIGSPHDAQKNDATRNVYFFLPFVLGIFGLIKQIRHARREFWIVFMFFLFNGIAIVVFLNQEPYQARERDYAYVGSFMAFAVWIAYGIIYLLEFIKNRLSKKFTKFAIPVITFTIPVWMFIQNFADHDRSGRYIVHDIAHDFLAALPQNSILFVNADNDTFPLWYMQEVEGFRPDVRIVNLSLLNADWYINGLRFRAYNAAPLAFGIPPEQYRESLKETCYIIENESKISIFKLQKTDSGYLYLKDALRFVANENDSSKLISGTQKSDFLPSRNLAVNDFLQWKIESDYLTKSELAMLDIIANNSEERPIYFSNVIESTEMLGLKRFTRKEGFCNALKTNSDTVFDANFQYKILTSQFIHNQTDTSININYDIKRFLRMIQLFDIYEETLETLISENKKAEVEILTKQMQAVFPSEKFTYDERFLILVDSYNYLKMNEKASVIKFEILKNLHGELKYINAQTTPFSYYLEARKIQIINYLKENL